MYVDLCIRRYWIHSKVIYIDAHKNASYTSKYSGYRVLDFFIYLLTKDAHNIASITVFPE